MMHVVLFDGPERESLLPLTYLRTCANLRVGIQTIAEKWSAQFDGSLTQLTTSYLTGLYPYQPSTGHQLYVNGACLPDSKLVNQIRRMTAGQVLMHGNSIIAFKSNYVEVHGLSDLVDVVRHRKAIEVEAKLIRYPEDILHWAESELLKDYYDLTKQKKSHTPDSTAVIRGDKIYIGAQTKIRDAIINSVDGPVFIDDKVEIMENAVIKGPVYIGKGTKIHVGAKIYAGSIFGPECRIGGEVKRTTILGYTNKGHDGYLGDSVLGEWCNLGANTNNSNLKHSYGKVKLWNISQGGFRLTERQFLGMIMGDHSKCAISTNFNTGTVTGIVTSTLDAKPPTFIPSFTWGLNDTFEIEKAVEVAKTAFARRSVKMSKEYEQVLRHLSRNI